MRESDKPALRGKFTPRSRKAWRDWLERNHASRPEVWLVFYKQHTGKPTLTYADAVEEAICFGWIDGVKRSIDDERYTHRFSPRKPDSRWSPTNRKRAARMAEAGLMHAAGRKAVSTARQRGLWEARSESIDLTLPRELDERLRRNRKAAAFFDSLARSYRTQFIAWINSARREETRQRRISESIELLSRGEKLGMR
jgi:uncharacterized protein YdeI (YjbR/CyaY-like superfamily)